jgi:sec-independent protein translocase protein TatA
MDGILAPWHWAILIAVVLLVFGPRKLPELGSSLGKSIAGFKKGLADTQEELKSTMAEASAAEPAETASLAASSAPAAATEAPEKTPVSL